MMSNNWKKQLTRENSLLDRGLRAIAYRDAIQHIGKASISETLITGKGRVTSLYYLPDDYAQQQSIIVSEFSGANIEKMSQQIAKCLEQAYQFLRSDMDVKNTDDLRGYYDEFKKYHSYCRGSILYGYWGEPEITDRMKKKLVKAGVSDVDDTVSKLSEPKEVKGSLRELYKPGAQKEREEFLRTINADGEIEELVEILSWFTFFYEVGERIASPLFDQFFEKLSEIYDEDTVSELEWYDPESFEEFLQEETRLTDSDLEERKEFYILMMTDGNIEILTAQKAKDYYEEHLREGGVTEKHELKGAVASKGKATGKVKIIILQKDQNKMKKDDILLSPMTTPRLMTAVKKAAAIVTDEGGMTAHAAIVSRELGIPCIVGTQHATQVFRDGDMVEVDAEKGVVRKI